MQWFVCQCIMCIVLSIYVAMEHICSVYNFCVNGFDLIKIIEGEVYNEFYRYSIFQNTLFF